MLLEALHFNILVLPYYTMCHPGEMIRPLCVSTPRMEGNKPGARQLC